MCLLLVLTSLLPCQFVDQGTPKRLSVFSLGRYAFYVSYARDHTPLPAHCHHSCRLPAGTLILDNCGYVPTDTLGKLHDWAYDCSCRGVLRLVFVMAQNPIFGCVLKRSACLATRHPRVKLWCSFSLCVFSSDAVVLFCVTQMSQDCENFICSFVACAHKHTGESACLQRLNACIGFIYVHRSYRNTEQQCHSLSNVCSLCLSTVQQLFVWSSYMWKTLSERRPSCTSNRCEGIKGVLFGFRVSPRWMCCIL